MLGRSPAGGSSRRSHPQPEEATASEFTTERKKKTTMKEKKEMLSKKEKVKKMRYSSYLQIRAVLRRHPARSDVRPTTDPLSLISPHKHSLCPLARLPRPSLPLPPAYSPAAGTAVGRQCHLPTVKWSIDVADHTSLAPI